MTATKEAPDELADWKRRARAAWQRLLATDESDPDAYYDARFWWALIAAEHYDLIDEIFRSPSETSDP